MSRLVALLLTLTLASTLRAGELGMSPMYLGNPHMWGWVPDHAPVLRGILWLDGWPLDQRWTEAAVLWNYAIVRTASHSYGEQLDDRAEARTAHVKALQHGVNLLAERTGHPELANVPFVASGYSRFSGSAQNLARDLPGRVVCFLTGFGVSGTTLGDKAETERITWLETPSQWLGAEWENIYDGGSKTNLLPHQWRRAPGVLRMASMTWKQYHNPFNFTDLGMIFIDQAIRLRVPADWDPRAGPPVLCPVREAEGWLGSHEGWAVPIDRLYTTPNESAVIAPFTDFTADRANASWILNEPLAWAWRAFNARHPKVRITAPSVPTLQTFAPTAYCELGLRSGKPFTVRAWLMEDEITRVEFFANNLPLGETSTFTGGLTGIGRTRDAECEATVQIGEPGMYGLAARYTLKDGTQGWSNPAPLAIHP